MAAARADGARRGQLSEPLSALPEFPSVAPPRLFTELGAPDPHDLQRTRPHQRHVVGARQDPGAVPHQLLQLLERLPARFDGDQGPAGTGAADQPEATLVRVVGDLAPPGRGARGRRSPRIPGRRRGSSGTCSWFPGHIIPGDAPRAHRAAGRRGAVSRRTGRTMLAVLDNYDSFTWNLVQMLGDLGERPRVYRNDEVTPEGLRRAGVTRLVVSPGPCTPLRGRDQRRGDPGAWAAASRPGRLPGPPGDRRGLRGRDGPRRTDRARQDVAGGASWRSPLRGNPLSDEGGAVSFARDRAPAAGATRRHRVERRPGRRRRDPGHAAPPAPRLGRPVPPRVVVHRGREAPFAELSLAAAACGPGPSGGSLRSVNVTAPSLIRTLLRVPS